jgi:hypothetical protein
MHVKIKLISTVMTVTLPFISISRTDGDIGSCMDNECVMNLYDHERYNSCLDG